MTELQSKILEIYCEVKRICDRHKLRYYAIYGTCIGAVRHKGFIPWDDDLDIGMPYGDYIMFMEIVPKELKKTFELLPMGKLNHSTCIFAKVHNVETTMIEYEELNYPDSYKGVYIDIFPMCGLPNNEMACNLFMLKAKIIAYGYIFSRRKGSAEASRTRKLFYNLFVQPITCLSKNFWLKQWNSLLGKHDFDTSYCIACFCATSKVIQRKWFDKVVTMPFENTEIPIPEGYNEYLNQEYGNYMAFPPETERIPIHSGGIIDLNNSYTVYQRKSGENNGN